MAQPTRPTSRSDFEIAIICALTIEADAVVALFDRYWADEDSEERPYGTAPGDPNAYTVGRIGRHNIVVARLPHTGKARAAAVAAYCSMSWPAIKLALVVGICGAVPFTADDKAIFLGDVIISEAVVQYDLGKQHDDGFVRKTDSLDPLPMPSEEILGFLAKLKGFRDKTQLEAKMEAHMAQLKENPRLEADYPGVKQDTLFVANHDHPDGKICDDANCKEKLIERRGLVNTDPKPVIHFGRIASGDTVMKSAEKRDSIAKKEEGVIAFEMESAGVWGVFPCVVIKGVCDYADSHKLKNWQRYAAATAAACTKAFLEHLVPWTQVVEPGNHATTRTPQLYLPFPANRNFVGRAAFMDALREKLFSDDDHSPNRYAITGLGGIGKTEVALNIAYWTAQNKPGWHVFWLPAFSMAAFEQACRDVFRLLDLEGEQRNARELVQAYLDSNRSGQWLLIIDNVDDDEQETLDFLPRSRRGRTLFTTRNQGLATRLARHEVVTLGELNADEAKDLLVQSLQDPSLLSDEEDVARLLDILTHLPLVIIQAAAYMKKTMVSVPEFIRLWQNTEGDMVELLEAAFSDDTRYHGTHNAVARTWVVSFEQIRKNPDASKLLGFISHVEPDAIPLFMLPPVEPEQRLELAVRLLCNCWLLVRRKDPPMLQMHRMVHVALRGWEANQPDAEERRQEALKHLVDIVRAAEGEGRGRWQLLLPHVLKAIDTSSAGNGWGQEERSLAYWAGGCLRLEGQTREAVKLLERVVEVDEATLAETHPSRTSSQCSLAGAYLDDGRVLEAIYLLEKLVAIHEATLAEDHPQRLSSQTSLAVAYHQNGQVERADKLRAHVVYVQQTLLREGQPDRLGSERALDAMHHVNEQVKGASEYGKSPSSEGLSAGPSSLFDRSEPPTCSVTTRDASRSAAFSNQVPIESGTQKSSSMNGSNFSIHSGPGSLLDEPGPYVRALAAVFLQHLGSDSEDSEGTGVKALATLLPEFAFRMSSQGNTGDHRDIAYIVSKEASSIIETLTESMSLRQETEERNIRRILASAGQSSPHTTEYSSDDQESSDDGRSDTVLEVEEQRDFRLKHLMHLMNCQPTQQFPSNQEDGNFRALDDGNVSAPEESDSVYHVRIERCRNLLTGSQQMDWLKRMVQARRALNFAHDSSLDLVGRSVKSAIGKLRKHIPSKADISRNRGPPTYCATISLDWSPLAFVRAQEYHQLGEDLLESVLTLTGNQEMAQACTAAEYMAQVWPTAGTRILRVLSKLVLAPDSVQDAILDDDTKVVAHLHQSSLKVATTGTRFGLTRTAEQLAWIGSAMQSPPETSGMTAFTCKISPSSSRFEKLEKGTIGSLDPIGSFDYNLLFQVDPLVPSSSEGEDGSCWHDMFRNFVIAEGFPIPSRQDPTPGLESSFELIARLIRAQFFSAFAGGLFLTTTAGTMLYAARVANEAEFWWHYMVDKEGEWISYPDLPNEAYTLGSQDRLDKLSGRIRSGRARHFFGWSRRIRNNIGASTAGYHRIQTPNYEPPPATIGVEKLLIGLATQVTIQVECKLGRKDTPAAFLVDQTTLHRTKMHQLKNRYVVLYDLKTKVAWLSDGASALLHLLRQSLNVLAETPTFVTLSEDDNSENDDSTVDNAKKSFQCLTNSENMKKLLWKDVPNDAGVCLNETMERRIDILYDTIVKIRPAIQQTLAVKGYQMDLSFKCCLPGFDFNQIAGLGPSCQGRAVQLQTSASPWIQLINALDAPVLFGKGFGDLFQVSDDLDACTRCLWNARIPHGLDLLAVSEADLCRIITKNGHNSKNFDLNSYTGEWVSVFDDICWKHPKSAMGGCLCPMTNTPGRFVPWHGSAGNRSTRNVLQSLEARKHSKRPQSITSDAEPSEMSPDSHELRHGAVLFGSRPVKTSDRLRAFFSRGEGMTSKNSDSNPLVTIEDQNSSSSGPSVTTTSPEQDRLSSQTSAVSPHLVHLASAQPSQDLSSTPATSVSTHTPTHVNRSLGVGTVPGVGGAAAEGQADAQVQPVVQRTSRLRRFSRWGRK